MNSMVRLKEKEIISCLYRKEKHSGFEHIALAPLLLLVGNQIFFSNTQHYDRLFLKMAYDSEEMPKGSYERIREGLYPNQFFITTSLLRMFGWHEGEKRPRFEQAIKNFLASHAKNMKFDSRLNWRRNGKLIRGEQRENIVTPGQLSFRLSIAANLLEISGSIISIVRTDAAEALEKSLFPLDLGKLFVYLGNGSHENYFFKETSWNQENKAVYRIFGDYISFLAKETRLKESNIASMIISGIKTPERSHPKKKPVQTPKPFYSPAQLIPYDPHSP